MLALPPQWETVHDVFHISMLWKYVPDPTRIRERAPPSSQRAHLRGISNKDSGAEGSSTHTCLVKMHFISRTRLLLRGRFVTMGFYLWVLSVLL